MIRSTLLCLLATVDAYVLAPGAAPMSATVRSASPTMQMGPLTFKVAAAGTAAVVSGVVAAKKLIPKKEDPAVSAFRSSLGSMETLSDLSSMKLEMEEKEGRTAGVWKEYVKSDGRKWYYNTENGTQQWTVPEEFVKLDEISAAAAAANAERGTSLS